MTDGLYFNAENEEDLQAIYESIEPNFRVSREKTEITAVFAGLGILLLLVGGMMSLSSSTGLGLGAGCLGLGLGSSSMAFGSSGGR